MKLNKLNDIQLGSVSQLGPLGHRLIKFFLHLALVMVIFIPIPLFNIAFAIPIDSLYVKLYSVSLLNRTKIEPIYVTSCMIGGFLSSALYLWMFK